MSNTKFLEENEIFFFSVCCANTDCSRQFIFDEVNKSCIKHTDLVTDDDFFDQKAFYQKKNYFYLLFMNDGKLINLQHFYLGVYKICEINF